MKTINGSVEVKITGADGKEKVETGPVAYPEFETVGDFIGFVGLSDLAGLANDVTLTDEQKSKLSDLCGAANYGFNLKARATVRAAIQSRLEGPDKAINKMVADLVKARAAAGKPITEEKAREMALALMGTE